MIILGTAILIAIFKTLLMSTFDRSNFLSFVGFIWTSLTPNLGGKPSGTQIDSRKSYKAIIFVSLLGGVIIWIAYRSFLTAELSIRDKKYPFNDLTSLSKTDWK